MACIDALDMSVVVGDDHDQVAINSAATALDVSVPEIAVIEQAAAAMLQREPPVFTRFGL